MQGEKIVCAPDPFGALYPPEEKDRPCSRARDRSIAWWCSFLLGVVFVLIVMRVLLWP